MAPAVRARAALAARACRTSSTSATSAWSAAIELESIAGAARQARLRHLPRVLRARRADPHHRRHHRPVAAADRRGVAHRPGDQHDRRRAEDGVPELRRRAHRAALLPPPTPPSEREGPTPRGRCWRIAGLPRPADERRRLSADLEHRQGLRRPPRRRQRLASTSPRARCSPCSARRAAARRRCCACSPASRRRPRARSLLDGRDLAGLPPYERPMNMMFQSYALFPHLTVCDNIAFGLRRDGLPEGRGRARASRRC